LKFLMKIKGFEFYFSIFDGDILWQDLKLHQNAEFHVFPRSFTQKTIVKIYYISLRPFCHLLILEIPER